MGNKQPNNDNTNGFVKYNPKDQAFFGAKTVVDTEREHIFKRRGVESDKAKQKEVLENLFSINNAGFTFCRTAIGASDFGINAYSYSEIAEDYQMEHFSVKRDKKYVRPDIK